MEINKWKYFAFDYLFRLFKGKRLTKAQMYEGKTPYISSSSFNNGVDAYISEDPNFKKNFLTFACYGSIGEVFYHPYDAWVSDNCNVMYLKNCNLNVYIAIFLISVIKKEKYRFSYGFTGKLQTFKKLKIKLPPKNNEPDFEFMESYIKSIIPNAGLKTESLINKCFNTLPINDNKVILQKPDWSYFRFDYLFDVKKGKRLTKADMEDGNTFFIGSSDSNNGLTTKISQAPIFKANTITVNYDGSVAEAFYQPLPYWALDSVNVLYPKFQLNVYTALFLTTIIRLEKYRFNYGRKWKSELMKKSKIKLPTKNRQPDFEFMENYIKSLPYSSSI